METESIEMNSRRPVGIEEYEPGNPSLKVAAALMRAQEKFDPILKDTNNPFYKSKYATLDQVISATRPYLRAENLVIVQENIQDGDRYGIWTRLIHLDSGEELTSALVAKPKEDTIQQIAGVLTYCRRYEYHTITGTASEDDDGAAASGTSTSSTESGRGNESARKPSQPTHFVTGMNEVKPVKANIPPAPIVATAANAGDFPHVTTTTGHSTVHYTGTSSPNAIVSTPSPDPNAIPTSAEFDAYMQKAFALAAELENAGVKAGRGLPVKAKLGKYVRKVAGCEDVHLVKHGQWEVIFTEFEKLMKSEAGKQEAVRIVNAANPEKEGK